MSGIVGIINADGAPVDRQLLRQMTEFQAYRGPDAQNLWISGEVGFGHSLLQTSAEPQPESHPFSLDGQVVITADARIDDRAELRRKLAARGYPELKQASDVELILRAYQTWGEDCVQHLLGDFAFALWDGPRRQLFCARDHLGVKPFYYVQQLHGLIFSNTLDCLRTHPQVSDELNDLAIADFLLFDLNQDKGTTVFADIKRLPPGHTLTYREGTLRLQRYWSLPLVTEPIRYSRPGDYVERFQELLRQAVADRLRTRQVAVLMSGGLDSSMVAAVAKDLLAQQSGPFTLHAYTAVFDRLIPDEERHYSGLVAKSLGLPIHYLIMDDYQLYERWEGREFRLPEPCWYPMWASWADQIQQVVGQSRVILTGDGGDNILCASRHYVHHLFKGLQLGRLARELGHCLLIHRRLPQIGLRSTLRRVRQGEDSIFPTWLNPSLVDRLELRSRWEYFTHGYAQPQVLRREIYQSLAHPMLQDYFEKKYAPAATGTAVAFYHPYYDVRLINFALALPPLPWCVSKILLREAARGVLPEEIRSRAKTPLRGNPVMEVLKKPAARWVDHFIPTPELARYVDRAAVPPLAGETNLAKMWLNLRPLNFNSWLSHFRPRNWGEQAL